MKNAHLRFGKLVYVRRSEKTATNIRVQLDAFVGEERGKAHLVSIAGGDSEIGALAAAFANRDLFTVIDPVGKESLVSLGERPLCFRGSILIPGRKRPLRHLVSCSQELADAQCEAKTTHHGFGQYSRALDQIRLCLEHRAFEKAELQRMCAELQIPADFDIAQISWRPDYDRFFYDQLSHRARRVYLFRGEYIFDLEKAVVVETPQLGHATYVFAKPTSMDSFLVLYTKMTKKDIRRNRDNASERLGFLGRVIHGTNPRAWLKEMRQRLGEKV